MISEAARTLWTSSRTPSPSSRTMTLLPGNLVYNIDVCYADGRVGDSQDMNYNDVFEEEEMLNSMWK
eukprot:7333071-Heterocapsa_arctica.AAC.1